MNVKEYIEKRNLSLYKISKKAELPYTTVCDLINGKTDVLKCNAETVYKLSKALGIKMEELIDKEEKAEFVEPIKAHTKQEFYQSMLRNRKNVILSRDSALEYMNLTDGNFSPVTTVYSTVDLPSPFIVKKIKNFKNIEYKNIDGILICSVSQSINDMLADEDSDLQILDQALNNYYYKVDKEFKGLNINQENLKRFNEEVPYAMQYYDN